MSETKQGRVIAIIGPAVDVEFENVLTRVTARSGEEDREAAVDRRAVRSADRPEDRATRTQGRAPEDPARDRLGSGAAHPNDRDRSAPRRRGDRRDRIRRHPAGLRRAQPETLRRTWG